MFTFKKQKKQKWKFDQNITEKHKLKINILIPMFSIFYIDYVLLLYFKMFLLNQLKYGPTKSISLFFIKKDVKYHYLFNLCQFMLIPAFLPL